jgi:DNA-binding response OmpR family regulator
MGRATKILIVEDDDNLRSLYRKTLVMEKYEVQDTGDAMSALQALDRNTPDGVVLDLELPDISGVAVAREIAAHAHTRNIPVIVVTGSARKMERVDAACVLRKPVFPDVLVKVVRACLASGPRPSKS